MDRDLADGDHGAVVMRGDVPGAPERHVGQAQEGVPPELEGRRPRVGGRSREGAQQVSLAGDGLDDADGDALVVEDGPLLDVKLEIGVELGPAVVRRQDPLDRESRPFEDLRERPSELRSGPFRIASPSRSPRKARLPRKSPTRFPSSSVNEAISRALAKGSFSSLMRRRHSRAARTPTEPSNIPPLRTVSMCEPAMTVFPGPSSRPKMLPAPSSRQARPASAILSLSHALASRSARLNEGRLIPPLGSRPNSARASMSARRRPVSTRMSMIVPIRSRGAPSSPGRPIRCRRWRPGRRWRSRC